MTNTFIHSRSTLENCARFQAKRGGLHPFLDRNGTKTISYRAAHTFMAYIWKKAPPPLLPPSEATPGILLYANWAMTTGNCCFPCCVDADGEAGVFPPAWRLLVGGWTPEHPRRLILPGQCVPPNIVRHSWRRRWVLRESCINNLDHPQLGTTCSPRWL